MIIKSHIRGGYRAAAEYLKSQGQNEKVRVVEISDPDAKNLDEAFHNMWVVANCTRATKPLHHISINPMKDERLTDKQVLAIVERCEQKYGYKLFQHQRVIIEHIKDGRQHFHVIWNRVNMHTTETIWPGQHWKKSKQICREMEKELGLKTPAPRRLRHRYSQKRKLKVTSWRKADRKQYEPIARRISKSKQASANYFRLKSILPVTKKYQTRRIGYIHKPFQMPRLRSKPFYPIPRVYRTKIDNKPDSEKLPIRRKEWSTAELLAWAWETRNYEVLASFGIYLHPDTFEP